MSLNLRAGIAKLRAYWAETSRAIYEGRDARILWYFNREQADEELATKSDEELLDALNMLVAELRRRRGE